MTTTFRLLVLLAALAASESTFAWGSQGHRMVGYVADEELTARTRIVVRRIMQADSLASVANWMDEVRDTYEGRSMQRWHFVTTKVCGNGEPSCKNGNCVTSRIEWARDTLKAGNQAEARKALSVMVHLVGDVHQPLHAADNGDFGGNGDNVTNRVCVEFGKTEATPCRLHTYWDTSLVKLAVHGMSEGDAARAWSANVGKLPATDSDRPADWATESFELAKNTVYRFEGFACKKNRLSFAASDDYDAAGQSVVRTRIAVAGKRLAKILNSIFD